jgi:hypothetical protein
VGNLARGLGCVVLGLACAAGAACSGAFGVAGAPVADASPSPDVTASIAPAVDASPADATPPADGGALDATVPSPCTSQQLFCDDFEGNGEPSARWDGMRTGAGPFDYDTTTFVSGARALRLRVTAGSGERSSDLRKAIAIPGPNARVTFHLRVDLPMQGSFKEISNLHIEPEPYPAGVGFQTFAVAIYDTGPHYETFRAFQDGGSSFGATPIPGAQQGRFVRGEIDLRYSGGTLTSVLRADGAIVATGSMVTPQPNRIVLRIGVPYSFNAQMEPVVRFDDVFVEAL